MKSQHLEQASAVPGTAPAVEAPQLPLATPIDPEAVPLEDEEADDELHLDYSEMEARARVQVPTGFKWKPLPPGARTYDEIMKLEYSLEVDDDL